MEPAETLAPSINNLGKYKKTGGSGSKGIQYQIDLLLVFLLNAEQKLDTWRISTMNGEAGYFDDIVLEYSKGAVLVQAKFKENSTKKITLEKLISTDPRSDFNLVKYFLSYQKIKKNFKIKNAVIYTNLTCSKEVNPYLNCTDNLSHFENGDGLSYTFSDKILPDLKAALIRSGNNDTDISEITVESLKDFLSHLQLYCNFSRNTLQDAIEKLLSVRKLQSKVSSREMYSKVMDWYQQDKGEYLTNVHVNAMFSEIWRDRYYQTLNQYNVHFQDIGPVFQGPKQVFHIVIEDIYLLHVMKVYRALWKDKSKVLWINPDDDVCRQKLVLEAFRKLHYQFLIIVWPKDTEEWVVTEICCELKDILNQGKKYKKVIIVAEEILISRQSELTANECNTIRDFVSFRDLADDTRSRLILQENIVFQGARISLNNLFAPQKVEEYKQILNLEILNKLVEGEVIKVGAPVLGLDENIAQYYLPRKFKRKIHKNNDDEDSEEKYSEGTIYDLKEKTIVITDTAGSGKSTVLSKVAMTLKEKYPSLWIININLNDRTEILRNFMIQGRKTIDVTDLLNSQEATKLTNALERILFSMEEKVILILDGVDEVVSDYKNLLIGLLVQCREGPNLAKIFVAARPHLTRELEIVFKVTAFALQPLSEQEQVDLLTAYWTHYLKADENNKGKCNQYAKALVEKMSLWIYGNSNKNFTDTPLQIKILADVFCETGKNWNGLKKYLNGVTDLPILPEKIDIVGLYQTFVKKMRNVFLEKANPNRNPTASRALAGQFEEYLAYHRSLALEAVMKRADHYRLTDYNKDRKNIENHILKMGIVQKSGDEFKFIHETFAEYFLAEGILKELQLPNENVKFQKLLVDEILSKKSFIATRAFLNRFLHKLISLPSDVIESYANLLTPERKYALQSLLEEEDFPAIHQLISKFFNGRIRRDITINVKSNFDKYYDYPWSYKTPSYSQDTFVEVKRPIFHSSTRSTQKLNTQQRSLEGNSRKYHTGPLHSAAEDGELKYIKRLIEIGVDINIKDFQGCTALHLAAKNGHLDAVEWLVQNGADTNFTDNRGNTALHLATTEGYPDIVKYLAKSDTKLTSRIDITRKLKELRSYEAPRKDITSLHSAAKDPFKNILRKNIKIRFDKGHTALHSAPINYDLDTVQSRTKYGLGDFQISEYSSSFDSDDDDDDMMMLMDNFEFTARRQKVVYSKQRTSLYSAVIKGKLSTVKDLIEAGVDVNADYNGHTALHLAVKYHNSAIVKFLIESGVDSNLKDDDGCTALHLAAENGNIKIVKLLVERGVDVHATNNEGCTALHLAVDNYNLDTVKCLAECGADLNLKGNDGRTALHLAVRIGALDIVKFLIQLGVDFNTKDSKGFTALHLAEQNDKSDIVKFLKEFGETTYKEQLETVNTREPSSNIITSTESTNDVKDVNKRLHTTVGHDGEIDQDFIELYRAALEGQLDSVKSLIDRGVDINIKDNEGRTALHFVAEIGHLETAKFLIRHGGDSNVKDNENRTPLHYAVLNPELDTVKFLTERGIDFNAKDNEGHTALHSAAENGALEAVKYLVEHKVDFNARDNKGRTPLHLAAKNDELDVVEFLEGRGSDLNARDNDGRTPLHFAVANGELDTVKFLVERGVDLNITDNEARTPLHFAAGNGELDTVKFVVERGVDLNIKDVEGRTPLHLAANHGESHTVKFLIEFGVDFNVKDADGRTALHLAAKNGELETVKLLVEYVDRNVKDNIECTPLKLAKENDHVDTVKFLTELGVHPSLDKDQATNKDQLESTRHLGEIPDVVALIQDDISDADIQIMDSESRTALGLADKNDALDTAKFLSDIGVDTTTENVCKPITTTLFRAVPFIEPRDTDDITTFYTENTTDVEIDLTADANNEENELLHKAALEGKLDTLRSLLDRGIDNNIKDDEGRTPLHLAASQGHSDIVEFLLDHDADVNLRDNDGNTALHVADEGEHLDIVKLLVNCGADVGIADGNGNTALHCAAECDRQNTVEYLVREANADVSVKGNGGRTPLHSAVKWGNLDVAKFLLKRRDTNVNSTDAVGRTPLHYAAEWHDSDIVELLVENEALVDVGDCERYTALHLAVKWRNLDTVEYLVGKGADVNSRNSKGRTVLHYVAKEGEFDTLMFLLENGADRSITDENDCTALNLAQSEGHMDVVEYLSQQITQCNEE